MDDRDMMSRTVEDEVNHGDDGRVLRKEELDMVIGGVGQRMHFTGMGTHNLLCSKCGHITEHGLTQRGTYACMICGTDYIK